MFELPSTVTNESMFRILVPANVSCHVTKKTLQKQSPATWFLLIGEKWRPFVCFPAQSLYKINTFVTMLGKDRSDRETLLSNSLLGKEAVFKDVFDLEDMLCFTF